MLLSALEAYADSTVIVYAPTIARVGETVAFLEQERDRGDSVSRKDGERRAVAQPGTLDVGRSARTGRNHRVRTRHQQAFGAGGDSSCAAEIDRAVLPGSGTRGPRWRAGRLRASLADARCGAARLLHRSRWPTRRKGNEPGTRIMRSASSPKAMCAGTGRSACTSARRRNGSAAMPATSARRNSIGWRVREEAEFRRHAAGFGGARARVAAAHARVAARSFAASRGVPAFMILNDAASPTSAVKNRDTSRIC